MGTASRNRSHSGSNSLSQTLAALCLLISQAGYTNFQAIPVPVPVPVSHHSPLSPARLDIPTTTLPPYQLAVLDLHSIQACWISIHPASCLDHPKACHAVKSPSNCTSDCRPARKYSPPMSIITSVSPNLSPKTSFHGHDRSYVGQVRRSNSRFSTTSTRNSHASTSPADSSFRQTPTQPSRSPAPAMKTATTVDSGTQYTPPSFPPTDRRHINISNSSHVHTSIDTQIDNESMFVKQEEPSASAIRQISPPRKLGDDPQTHTTEDRPVNGQGTVLNGLNSAPQPGIDSPSKRARGPEMAKKVMPRDYMKCNVTDLGHVIAGMLQELVELNDKRELDTNALTRFHSRYVAWKFEVVKANKSGKQSSPSYLHPSLPQSYYCTCYAISAYPPLSGLLDRPVMCSIFPFQHQFVDSPSLPHYCYDRGRQGSQRQFLDQQYLLPCRWCQCQGAVFAGVGVSGADGLEDHTAGRRSGAILRELGCQKQGLRTGRRVR